MNFLKKINWYNGLFLISGCYVVAIFSAGGALAEIGLWSILVWLSVVLVGLMQAVFLYRLAKLIPGNAGGTSTYSHQAFTGNLKIFSFISSWCYEVAWTPGIALNCLLIWGVINPFFPSLSGHNIVFSITVLLILYGINYIGIAKTIISSYVTSLFTLIPFIALIYLAVRSFSDIQLHEAYSYAVAITPALFFKWFFVIAWTGYAVEMISSVVSETASAEKHLRKLFLFSGVISTLTFTGIPVLLAILIPDWQVIDPFAALLPLFVSSFGWYGSVILSVFLVSSLLLSAIGFIIPTTRTIYQMSQDELLPAFFGKINRYGAPAGSFVFDICINLLLLMLFKDQLFSLIATANVAYICVFILLPVAYYLVYKHHNLKLSIKTKIALVFLFLINTTVLFYGGLQWGNFVFFVGCALVLIAVPLFFLFKKLKVGLSVATLADL